MKWTIAGAILIGTLPLAVAPAAAEAQAARTPDVIYVPTPPDVVDKMLEMAAVKDGLNMTDVAASQGIDIDPERIGEARANAEEAGVADEVTFRQEDLFKADFSDATVVTLYLLDSLNEKLRPRLLKELKPGTRIVSHAFRMGDWEPEATADVDGRMVYFWTVPKRR